MVKEPLLQEYMEDVGGYAFYRVYSPNKGMAVLQEETGIIYPEVAMREDDPRTYSEVESGKEPEPEPDSEDIVELQMQVHRLRDENHDLQENIGIMEECFNELGIE